jgi:hypothetical protein
MWVGYRSVFGVDWKEAARGAQIAAEQMEHWLTREGLEPADFEPRQGRYRVGGGAQLTVTEAASQGHFKAVRYRLKQPARAGVHWYTSLTFVALSKRPDKELREHGYFMVEVAARAEEPNTTLDERVRTPDLTGLLLDAVTATDGPARLTTAPQLIEARDVDSLINILCDPGRRMPAVVAVPGDGDDLALWRERFTQATCYLPGIASLYLLTEDAGRLLNKEFEHHWTSRALRTFHLEPDPASMIDGERHPVLTWSWLESDIEGAQAILTHRIRAVTAAAALPEALHGVSDALFQANEQQRVIDEETRRVQRALQFPGSDEDEFGHWPAWGPVGAGAGASVGPVHGSSGAGGLSTLNGANGSSAHNHHSPAEHESEPEHGPFDLLIESLGDFPNLVVTADLAPMRALGRHKDGATFAGKAREALAALDSYAALCRSGGWDGGGFRRYCEDSQHGGRIIPAGQVAANESDTVRQDPKMAKLRRFRVPSAVSVTGSAMMWAHVKIGNSGQTAPRLYFLDDTNGETGQIVVGYLGPHLKNTKSS